MAKGNSEKVQKSAGGLGGYYGLKGLFETVLGKASFAAVKEFSSLAKWKKETIKLLEALVFAIGETVEIADEDWVAEIQEEFARGHSLVSGSRDFDELFASLSATLGHISFLQLGMIPQHGKLKSVPLSPKSGAWKMDAYRSVQYVRNDRQKNRLKSRKERNSAIREKHETEARKSM